MSILWTNNANSTVSGSLTAAGTTFSVASGTGALFPNPVNPGDYFMITFYDQLTKTINEICKCTARSGDTLTITRAQEGTTGKAWNSGDIVINGVTAGTLANFVQQGPGAASTSMIYVGTDTSATPNLIVCNTTPVPASYAVGMQFNIKVKNQNTGAVNLQLNGLASVAAVRTDGSPMVAGNVVAGEEMIFIYNGVNFTSTIPPIPQAPPQTTFYVNPSGNDGNSGFANTPQAAFATISGAMYAIKQRYISQNQITIRVADSSYVDSIGDVGSYIASWNIIGNSANPGNCVIQATSATGSGYPSPNSQKNGRCVIASPASNITLNGFTLQSYEENATSTGGTLTLINCNFTAPIGDASEGGASSRGGGQVFIYGNCQYTGNVPASSIFFCDQNSYLRIGYLDQYISQICVFNIQGNPTVNMGTFWAISGGIIIIHNASGSLGTACTFTGGVPTGPKYRVDTTGGLTTDLGNAATYCPGSMPGVVAAPGYAY